MRAFHIGVPSESVCKLRHATIAEAGEMRIKVGDGKLLFDVACANVGFSSRPVMLKTSSQQKPELE
jgi:hypothetical protein